MSARNNRASIRDALYEAPGPRTRRRMHVATAVSAVLVLMGIAAIVRQFYVTGQLAPRYWSFLTRPTTWAFLLQGFRGTVSVALVAGAIALVLGLLLMLGRMSSIRALSAACRGVIDFFRGVPSLLLIYFFFLVVPQYGIKLSSFWMITLPVALAASGVLAEVLRAGVNAVPAGQVEAARSIGMRPAQIMRTVILPQAVVVAIPLFGNNLIMLFKETSLAFSIGVIDMMGRANVVSAANYGAYRLELYVAVAVIYWVVCVVIMLVFAGLERGATRSRRPARA